MKRYRNNYMALLIALLLLASGLLCGCSGGSASVNLYALDTYITMQAYGRNAKEALQACSSEIKRLEGIFSPTLENSDIARINTSGGEKNVVSEETASLMAEAFSLMEETGGAFDITLRPLTTLWGFGGETRLPAETEIAEALTHTGMPHITLDGRSVTTDPGSSVDLGAIAKGYITDRLILLLQEQEIPGALLVLGGNVYAHGKKQDGSAWRIGIRDPFDENGIVGIVEAEDLAVITSGGYQRYFELDGVRYHHILSPETGCPADAGIAGVTILSRDGTLADALSTALFVMGTEKAEAYWRTRNDFEFIAVLNDGSLLVTEGCAFTAEDPSAPLTILYR